MQQRLVSSLVMVPIVAGVFLLGMPWLALGVGLLSIVAASETFRLLAGAGFPVRRLPGVIAPPLAVLVPPLLLATPNVASSASRKRF